MSESKEINAGKIRQELLSPLTEASHARFLNQHRELVTPTDIVGFLAEGNPRISRRTLNFLLENPSYGTADSVRRAVRTYVINSSRDSEGVAAALAILGIRG
ncbi:MAG: hypothetical protein KGH66_00595 [Candidatus Micrarchaeota archaeon]|nr:hypothetical protein [Candidatus Micrarchaeota archaeon]